MDRSAPTEVDRFYLGKLVLGRPAQRRRSEWKPMTLNADDTADFLELKREVARLTATKQIERLILDHFDAADRGDFDRQADLLARAHVRYVHGETVLLDVNDRDAFRQAIIRATNIYEDGTPRAHHVVSNIVIDVDDAIRHARSRCYTTVLRATKDMPLRPVYCGVFHDTFARDAGGWYFVDRLGEARLSADHSS
jgi:SnoaL-like domain